MERKSILHNEKLHLMHSSLKINHNHFISSLGTADTHIHPIIMVLTLYCENRNLKLICSLST